MVRTVRYIGLSLLLIVAAAVSATEARADTFNLADFGAVGDGVTDDGPALQQALDALAEAGGGTLFVPAGRYAILTPVSKNFSGLAPSIEITGVPSSTVVDPTAGGQGLSTGLNLVSEFYPRTGTSAVAIQIIGLQSVLISELAFVGTAGVATDAVVTLDLIQVKDATIRHCEFYGLLSELAGGAIVRAIRSGLTIQQSKFLGSFGNSGTYTPVVENLQWQHIAVSETVFLDYGQRPELYGKGLGATLSWVNVGNADAVTSDSPRREVVIDRVFLDEGHLFGLSALPYRYQPASAPIDLIYVTGLRMNVSNITGNAGHYFAQPRAVLIESSRYQWSHSTDAALDFIAVNRAIVDRSEFVDDANTIRADAATGSLTVIDSIYQTLNSQAQSTQVLTTENPEDDPVQHVRQQFSSILGREPDAAAHYYWSDLILLCGDDPNCIASRHALLGSYLDNSPNEKFKIEGQVIVDDGAPLAGALVALTGSQTVTTLTDVQGRYTFSNLPTSGDYTVTVSKIHYGFFVPSVNLNTPANDQTINFSGLIDRHTISGRIADAGGQALPNAAVTLTGSEGAATQTDSGGTFVFEGLAAGQTYTITPSNLSYVFTPQMQIFENLSADQMANFTLVTHSITGRVTKPDGSPIASAVIDLSGGANKSTITD